MEQVTFEQFIASAILKFIKLDKFDIAFLIKLLKRNGIEVLEDGKFNDLKFYISCSNGYIKIDDCLTLESEVDYNTTLESYIKKIENKKVKNILENLDSKEYILRKLEKMDSFKDYQLKSILNPRYIDILEDLVEKGYVIEIWNDDIPCEDYKEFKLSKKGKVELFKLDYKNDLDKFIETLNAKGYDDSLINDFLMKQDLSMQPWRFLTTSDFLEFCAIYDRNPNKINTEYVNYHKLISTPESILDEKGKEMMQNMLSVWDDGHCIYICHPNHIFKENVLTSEVRNIEKINWNNISIEKMFNKNDYKTFIFPTINDSFSYIHKRLGIVIMKEIKKGNKDSAISYVTVVEKYPLSGENFYIIRGLIKGDSEGYSVAFNPEYEKSLPKSIWEKSARFSGNEVPKIYQLKRENN